MYIETMETILSRAHKIIIDAKSGSSNVIYIPLDKLADAIRSSSNAAAAVPVPAAPAPAAASTPSPASVGAGDDAHSRDRPER